MTFLALDKKRAISAVVCMALGACAKSPEPLNSADVKPPVASAVVPAPAATASVEGANANADASILAGAAVMAGSLTRMAQLCGEAVDLSRVRSETVKNFQAQGVSAVHAQQAFSKGEQQAQVKWDAASAGEREKGCTQLRAMGQPGVVQQGIQHNSEVAERLRKRLEGH